jgi:hypothetical protein
MEGRTRRRTAQLFDLVEGTSTFGILALGLTVPKSAAAPLYTAGQLLEMDEREGPRIFSRSAWHRLIACGNLTREKYPNEGIESVLWEYFGDARLSGAAADVLVPSYEIEHSFPFSSRVPMPATARPTNFQRAPPLALLPPPPPTSSHESPHRYQPRSLRLIDGGVFANNPAACALVEARSTHPDAADFRVVSLGTCELNHSVPYDTAKNWGAVQWAIPVLDTVFDGVSRTIDYQLRELLPNLPGQCQRYYRFQTTLDGGNFRLDNASLANITALKGLAGDLVERESATLDQLAEEPLK